MTAVLSAPSPAAPTGPAVGVKNISKKFANGVLAVDQVSLDVQPGEFVCLLGPSGSGKTTLLRIIGGFEQADEGRVALMGEDVTALPPAQRRTNMVFQHHALFPHLSVHDNVSFGLRMRKMPAPAISERVDRTLDLVRLKGFGERKIDQLSGGQRQRIAIARAIVNEPAVLLLDEPLGALDLRLRLELQEELRRLQRSLGSPFILVTHDQTEAMAMADRIVVMNEGRIEQIGSAEDIYRRPATLFVARFIGHTNLISGRISADRGAGDYTMAVGDVTIPCRSPSPFAVGQEVVLSVREEAVTLGCSGESSEFTLEGRIIDRTFLGPSVRYDLGVGDEPLRLMAELRADEGEALAPGTSVRVGWRIDQASLFERR
jgi:spermidine/putrescine transport system ATP-binding protein